jgi:hypothetical protein
MEVRKLKRFIFLFWLMFLTLSEVYLLPSKSFADSGSVITDVHPVDPVKAKRAQVLWERGNAYADKGLTKKADEYWELAKQLDPSLSKAGMVLNSDSPSVPAAKDETDLTSVISFNSDPDRPYNNLVKNFFDKALLELRNKNYSQALESINQAQKLDPDNSQVQSLKNIIESKNSNVLLDRKVEEAKEQLVEGNVEEANEIVSGILQQRPDFQAALDLEEKIKESNNMNDSKETQSDLRRTEKKERKNHLMKKKASLLPSNGSEQDSKSKADEAYNLGLQSYRNGDLAGAKKFWNDVLGLDPGNQQARRYLDRLLEEHPELK